MNGMGQPWEEEEEEQADNIQETACSQTVQHSRPLISRCIWAVGGEFCCVCVCVCLTAGVAALVRCWWSVFLCVVLPGGLGG